MFMYHEQWNTPNAVTLRDIEHMTLGKAAEFIQSTLEVLVEDRNNEEHFNKVWNKIETFCQTHDISRTEVQPTPTGSSEVTDQSSTATPPPKKKRSARTSSKLDDFVVTSTVGKKEDVVDDKKACRIQVYYQIYDHIIGQFKSRFSDESLIMARAIDSFLNFDYKGALPFINHYKSSPNIKINDDLLQAELKILKNLFSKVDADPNKKIDPVKFIFKNKDVAPNSYILGKISATILISSATAERSFSGTNFKLK